MRGIIKAEFVAWAKAYDGARFHAVLCDPPYGLEFMGKEWDSLDVRQPGDPTFHKSGAGPFDRAKVRHSSASSYGGSVSPSIQRKYAEWASALLSLLHPGALVFCFGGTRTWHRLACGFEDAGFEIWDTLMWLHGQGFPKAQAIDKLIDKKLGNEREIVGKRKRPGGPAGFTSDKGWNDGPMKNDDSTVLITKGSKTADSWSGHKTAALKPAWEPILCFRAPRQGKNYAELAMEYGSGALNVDGGRIPIGGADDIHAKNPHTHGGFGHGEAQVYGDGKGSDYKPAEGRYPANLVLDEESAEMLDEQSGPRAGCKPHHVKASQETARRNKEKGWGSVSVPDKFAGFNDSGGASRFFYCAKASRSERGKANKHPTVKPIALTKWLATLLLPPDSAKPRRLLVPFAGSGSEMIGAIEAGWEEVVGIEQSEEYAEINSDLAVQRPLPV